MDDIFEQRNKLLSSLSPSESAHLSFFDQCAAFNCVYRGFNQNLVAKTFGITSAAMSHLANCQKNPRLYKRVADEFTRLGERAFDEVYFNQDILDRLQRHRLHMAERADLRRGLRRGRSPNPEANSHAGFYWDHSRTLILKITWVPEGPHNHPPGWYLWVKLYQRLDGRALNEDYEPLPFLSSKQVYVSLLHPGLNDPIKIEDSELEDARKLEAYENKKDKPLDKPTKED